MAASLPNAWGTTIFWRWCQQFGPWCGVWDILYHDYHRVPLKKRGPWSAAR